MIPGPHTVDERGVSPVIAGVLLLGITVIVIAAVTPAILGMPLNDQTVTANGVQFSFHYDSGIPESTEDSFGTTGADANADALLSIRVESVSGEMDAGQIGISGAASGGNLADDTTQYSALDEISTGDTLTVWMNSTETVSVTWSASDGSESDLLGSYSLPDAVTSTVEDSDESDDSGDTDDSDDTDTDEDDSDEDSDDSDDSDEDDTDEDDDFSVEDGGVVPENDYTAKVNLLGTGFTNGIGGNRIPIELDITVGDDSYEPWSGNINDGGNPRSTTFDDRSSGEKVSVTATTKPQWWMWGLNSRTVSSTDSDGYVKVLRDGDTPPNLEGFGDQDSASSYVQPYLDDDGKINIADNEAIFLFELGGSRTGAAADYQDVVVLVTIET